MIRPALWPINCHPHNNKNPLLVDSPGLFPLFPFFNDGYYYIRPGVFRWYYIINIEYERIYRFSSPPNQLESES